MRILVIGGTGFIGYRLVRLLVARGSIVTCMDTHPDAHSFADLGGKVTSVRGDVTQFDEVLTAMIAAKPDEIADIVRSYLPDANISFQHERGAKERNATYLLDNRRLLSEFGIAYRPFRERVLSSTASASPTT